MLTVETFLDCIRKDVHFDTNLDALDQDLYVKNGKYIASLDITPSKR